MGLSFLPKEYEFFDMFDNLANHCISASKQIQASVSADNFAQSEVQKIKNIEHAADKITYEIFEKLNNTFITPIEREDIHSLAHELDNIVDLILKISNMMTIYNVDKVNKKFLDVLKLIDTSIEYITKAVNGLRNLKKGNSVHEYCREVNNLENIGDQLRNEAIADLFGGGFDAIYIMKWKDIFLNTEKVLDQCEDVAKIIESIIVKQA